MEKEKKEIITEKVDKTEYDEVVRERDMLKEQLEGLIKRYKKLSALYNDAIEKILSE
jgi:hypothetical protein